VDVDAKDDHGETALFGAAMWGNPSIVKLLIEAGADVSIRDTSGITASQIAERNGYEAIAKAMPIWSVTEEVRDHGRSLQLDIS
jgi:ankyrin repeat protein